MVKSKPIWNKLKVTLVGTPPRIFKSILAGFNTVANHIYLIILPVLIDMVLWLGPKLTT